MYTINYFAYLSFTMKARIDVPTKWDLRIFPTRKSKQYSPSLLQITAFLLKSKVCALLFGWESLANIIPAVRDCMKTPVQLWSIKRNAERGQWASIPLKPYPMVCWVSIEKRRAVMKSKTLETHGFQSSSSVFKWSPWPMAKRNQQRAKNNHEAKNPETNMRKL